MSPFLWIIALTLKRLGYQFDLQSIFQREGKALLFVNFNIIISHNFPKNVIKILQVFQKI